MNQTNNYIIGTVDPIQWTITTTWIVSFKYTIV